VRLLRACGDRTQVCNRCALIGTAVRLRHVLVCVGQFLYPQRQANDRRALRFNRLKMFGGDIPDDLADLQAAYEAKRARRLAIRAAIDAQDILQP
jgi:hypothetical protein